MKRSDIEKLTDELIGQAVLLLLKRKAPVNSMALLTELRSLQAIETDASRRRVYTLSGKSASLNSGKGKVH